LFGRNGAGLYNREALFLGMENLILLVVAGLAALPVWKGMENRMRASVTGFGMFVELESTVEGIVRFENMGDEYFRYDETNKKLIGERSKFVYKIGDKVKVRVIEANKQLRKVAFEIILNDEENIEEDSIVNSEN
jgi:transcriptional accessory protein Tex/SPT6